MADIFAHAAGLLLLAHTGRIRMFGASAPHLMERFVDHTTSALAEKKRDSGWWPVPRICYMIAPNPDLQTAIRALNLW